MPVFQAPYNQVRYMLLGEAGVIQYFMVDAATGEVSLKKSLMDDLNMRERYQVSRVWRITEMFFRVLPYHKSIFTMGIPNQKRRSFLEKGPDIPLRGSGFHQERKNNSVL